MTSRRQQHGIDAVKSMSNPLSIEERPGLLISRYSRVIGRYSVQEILLEYCICLVLLVSVALISSILCFLRSRFCSGASIDELVKCTNVWKILDGLGKICLTRGILLVKRTFSTDVGSSVLKRSSCIYCRFKKMEHWRLKELSHVS